MSFPHSTHHAVLDSVLNVLMPSQMTHPPINFAHHPQLHLYTVSLRSALHSGSWLCSLLSLISHKFTLVLIWSCSYLSSLHTPKRPKIKLKQRRYCPKSKRLPARAEILALAASGCSLRLAVLLSVFPKAGGSDGEVLPGAPDRASGSQGTM